MQTILDLNNNSREVIDSNRKEYLIKNVIENIKLKIKEKYKIVFENKRIDVHQLLNSAPFRNRRILDLLHILQTSFTHTGN